MGFPTIIEYEGEPYIQTKEEWTRELKAEMDKMDADELKADMVITSIKINERRSYCEMLDCFPQAK